MGPASRLDSRLEANAVVLFDGGEPAAIVTADLLYVGGDVRRLVLEGLDGRLAEDRLFTAASHTHSAPGTSPVLPALGEVKPAYVRFVAAKISGLLVRLLEAPTEDGTLRAGQSLANHSVNRRRRQRSIGREKHGSSTRLLPNLRGPRDETVSAVILGGEDGQPGCVLWSYACHPVCFPDVHAVSAEYPGVVRSLFRCQFRDDLPVLFLQGFSGDTRPRAILTAGARGRLNTLLNRHPWHRYSAAEWEAWARSLGGAVHRAASHALRSQPLDERVTTRRTEESLGWAFAPAPPDRSFTMHMVSLGPALRIVGASAEPLSSYSAQVRRLAPPGLTITAGCIDETFGYLPTASMLHEGGYEVDGFRRPFGIEGQFLPSIERAFLERVEELLAEA